MDEQSKPELHIPLDLSGVSKLLLKITPKIGKLLNPQISAIAHEDINSQLIVYALLITEFMKHMLAAATKMLIKTGSATKDEELIRLLLEKVNKECQKPDFFSQVIDRMNKK